MQQRLTIILFLLATTLGTDGPLMADEPQFEPVPERWKNNQTFGHIYLLTKELTDRAHKVACPAGTPVLT